MQKIDNIVRIQSQQNEKAKQNKVEDKIGVEWEWNGWLNAVCIC